MLWSNLVRFGRITLRLSGRAQEVTAGFAVNADSRIARFVSEWFPDDVPDGFQGRLSIESDFPVSIVALQTCDRRAVSAVPALIPER